MRRHRTPLAFVALWLTAWGLAFMALWSNQPPPFVRPTVPPGRILIYSTTAEVQR